MVRFPTQTLNGGPDPEVIVIDDDDDVTGSLGHIAGSTAVPGSDHVVGEVIPHRGEHQLCVKPPLLTSTAPRQRPRRLTPR